MGIPLFPILPHVSTEIPTSLLARPSRFGTSSGLSLEFHLDRNGQFPSLGLWLEDSIETCREGEDEPSSLGCRTGIDGCCHWHVPLDFSFDLWSSVSRLTFMCFEL